MSEDFTARARKYWKEAGVENKVCDQSYCSELGPCQGMEWTIFMLLDDFVCFWSFHFVFQCFKMIWYFCTGPLEDRSSHRDSTEAGWQQRGWHLWLRLHRCRQGGTMRTILSKTACWCWQSGWFGNNSEHIDKILVIRNLMMFDHPAKLRQLLRVEPDLAEEGGHHCHRQCSLERASGENK